MHPELAQVDQLTRLRRFKEAKRGLDSFMSRHNQQVDAYIALAKLHQSQAQFEPMLSAAEKACELAPDRVVPQFQMAEACIHCGEIHRAINTLRRLQDQHKTNTKVQQNVAEMYSHLGRFDYAWQCLDEAVSMNPNDSQLLYNAAAAAMAVGELERAEELFDNVIEKSPEDYDAYYNRSTLRKQDENNNHIDELLSLVDKPSRAKKGEVQLHYALAKEYEDLKQWSASFSHLKKGADARNAMLSYDVQSDIHTMDSIAKHMDKQWCGSIGKDDSPGPIFILGMPRTGTTLVDRILNAHSKVSSLGEINDFVLSMMAEIGPVKSKVEAVERSTTLNFDKLAQSYRDRTQQRTDDSASFLIDKTPTNFLYIALIAKALPNAKIINLNRHPMDTCYAIYKTLFRMGYPFSYELNTLGKYYASYHRLMQHWNRVLPERIYTLSYEALVADTETEAKKLLAYCGLPWEQECLSFYSNKSAVATASAAQVRKPVYASSVQKWQNFEEQLAPLKDVLIAEGLTL